MTIKIIGKSLYQYDIGRQIEIIQPEEFDEVHFACEGDEEALVIAPKKDGDKLVADIPNIHLQRGENALLHIYIVKDCVTIYHTSTIIYEREKPSDYFYEETEIKRYETLEAKVNQFEEHNKELEKQIEDMGEKVGKSVEEFGERIDDIEKDVGEIDEVANTAKRIAEGASRAVVFDTTEEMSSWLTVADNVALLRIGDNLFIRDTDVPDYWWDGKSPVESEAKTDLTNYPTFDDLTHYVKNTDYAGYLKHGVVAVKPSVGTSTDRSGTIVISRATEEDIDKKANEFKPIVPKTQDYAFIQSLINNANDLTDEQKAKAQSWLGGMMIKVIKPDKNGKHRIINMDSGLYYVPTNTEIYYGSLNDTIEVFNSGDTDGYLMITVHEPTNSRAWYLFSAYNSKFGDYLRLGRIVNNDDGTYNHYSFRGLQLNRLLDSAIPSKITGKYTFSVTPLITAEQTDFTESSDNIPKMSWVQGVVEKNNINLQQSIEEATELKNALETATDEVAKDETVKSILETLNQSITLLSQLAENSNRAGSLNGFGLNLSDDGAVILTYSDPETGELQDSAMFPRETTLKSIDEILDNINENLKILAEKGDGNNA